MVITRNWREAHLVSRILVMRNINERRGWRDPSAVPCANYNASDAGPVFARAFHRVNSKQPQGLRKVGATFRPRRAILTGLRNFSYAKNPAARPRR